MFKFLFRKFLLVAVARWVAKRFMHRHAAPARARRAHHA